ncbi:MAG TPA: shikimate kinase [Jatrophihabitans sp.]|nr:shikimate kinase [Jatrophihabitans sp.]
MPVRAVLVGLPGVGKSSVGTLLASRWAVPFADSDELVVAAAGRSIPQLFSDEGESGFRVREAAAILAALADFDGVLALGGGAVTTAEVRHALAAAGVPVVLLTASRQVLLERIGRTDHRPLLAQDPASRLAELEAERAELYRSVATCEVHTAGLTLAAVTEAVAARMAT